MSQMQSHRSSSRRKRKKDPSSQIAIIFPLLEPQPSRTSFSLSLPYFPRGVAVAAPSFPLSEHPFFSLAANRSPAQPALSLRGTLDCRCLLPLPGIFGAVDFLFPTAQMKSDLRAGREKELVSRFSSPEQWALPSIVSCEMRRSVFRGSKRFEG